MNVHRFDNVGEFYRQVSGFLAADEASNILHLGLLNTWLRIGAPETFPYLALAEDQGQVQAVIIRTPPLRASISRALTPEAAHALADALYEEAPDMSGLMGENETSRAFAERWQQLSGCTFKLNRAERIYRNDKLIPVRNVRGSYQVATLADVELLATWLRDFELEADPSSQAHPLEHYERGVRLRIDSDPTVRGLRVWVDQGEIVSMAGHAGPTPNAIRIGPVYTPPDKRGCGYASALTAALTQELFDQGRKFVALFTDLSNPVSNKIYQQIGYVPVSDVDEYVFTEQEGG